MGDSARFVAGLGVTDPEPLPPGDSLWNFDNVVITPHIASAAESSNQRRIGVISENIRRFAKGEPLINAVNKAKGYQRPFLAMRKAFRFHPTGFWRSRRERSIESHASLGFGIRSHFERRYR